jgi:hypothetical protein
MRVRWNFLIIITCSIATLAGCTSIIPESFVTRYETGKRVELSAPKAYHYVRTGDDDLTVYDFDNQVFYRNEQSCGDKGTQRGSRSGAALVSILGSKGLLLRDAHFECSTQNTIFINESTDIVIDNVSAAYGSDNALEIRDSQYVVVKNSLFSDVRGNKCVETENSIVFFVNTIMTRCEKGFAGERTSTKEPEIVFFIDSRISIPRDDDAYAFVCDSRVPQTYGELYLIRTMSNAENVNCPVSRELPQGLLPAIEANDFDAIRSIMAPIIEEMTT